MSNDQIGCGCEMCRKAAEMAARFIDVAGETFGHECPFDAASFACAIKALAIAAGSLIAYAPSDVDGERALSFLSDMARLVSKEPKVVLQ